jgi:murein L,D-transpeptidase YcbB/YkuD
VQAAVANFQRTAGLPPSGMLTARTIAALNGWSSQEGEIIANMERWRWLPRDLGKDHIEVNIPDFSLSVLHGGAVVHQARVIVGKPENPTPVFSQKMEFLIVNPYWNVPYSIIKKEMLPKLASDPNYFERHGYEVVERGNTLIVRQPPGEENALGRIKFMFPNAYSVYLHDTPSRSLFENDQRALSHGCVRVDQPFKLAEVVLGRDNGWSEERVRRLVGRGERAINLPRPIPIHLMYFTAFVDETGHLQLRDDLYGYSHRVWEALHPTG